MSILYSEIEKNGLSDVFVAEYRPRKLDQIAMEKVANYIDGSKQLEQTELENSLDKYTCISFDLFDTLITRQMLNPDDLFNIVEKKLKLSTLGVDNFAIFRKEAQEKCGLTNPTIDDIYNKIHELYSVSNDILEIAKKYEIEEELRQVRPRKKVIEVFNKCVQCGKHVSIVTDMYLPQSIITLILEKCEIYGYEELYISCEHKMLKIQGLLNRYKQEMLKKYDDRLDEFSFAHLGDNLVHDGMCAELSTMTFFRISSCKELACKTALLSAVNVVSDCFESLSLGMVISRVFDDPFIYSNELKNEKGVMKIIVRDCYDYAILFFAPIISYFTMWIASELMHDDYEDVLFAARDGFLLQKCYDLLRDDFANIDGSKSELPKGMYFYTSRKASVAACFENEAYINLVMRQADNIPIHEVMINGFGLTEEEIIPFDYDSNQTVYEYVWKHYDVISKKSIKSKKNYLAYLGHEKMKIAAKYAFVDLVSSGTTQKSLQTFVPFELQGLYLGYSSSNSENSLPMKAVFTTTDNDSQDFFDTYKVLESVLTSIEPSLNGFDEKGQHVFCDELRTSEELAYVSKMQEACLDYFQLFLELGAMLFYEEYLSTGNDRNVFWFQLFAGKSDIRFQDDELILEHFSVYDDWISHKKTGTSCTKNNHSISVDINNEIQTKRGEVGHDKILSTDNFATTKGIYELWAESLFSWFPFEKEKHVLLVDSFDSIKERKTVSAYEKMLIDKGLFVDKINLFECISENVLKLQYEYIIVEKALYTKKELVEIVGLLHNRLAKNGKLFFVCHNRFAIHNWCGGKDALTKNAFGGIRDSQSRITLSDIKNYLNGLGISYTIFFPTPDYRHPQAIYSENYLPKAGIRDRVVPSYTENERLSVVFRESDVSDGLVDNNVFSFFANDFMIECSKDCFTEEVKGVVLSADRGETEGFATILYSDKVIKQVLSVAGIVNLDNIVNNLNDLRKRGIAVVPFSRKTDSIEMPYIDSSNLAEYIKKDVLKTSKKNICEKTEEVLKLFDNLWENIIQSSDHIPFEDGLVKDDRFTSDNSGPILSKAYIDMIPYNCFYDKGVLLFYDQEFVKKAYPAKYVMFRAIRYTYLFAPELDDLISIDTIMGHYGISNTLWQLFMEIEAEFIEDNRKYDELEDYYKGAYLSDNHIEQNIERLMGGSQEVSDTELSDSCEEQEMMQDYSDEQQEQKFIRASYEPKPYEIDEKLHAIQKVQLDLLKKFIEICDDNELNWCMCYGSLLGTVRHAGVIPWDDDVDVMLPREDYDKLAALAKTLDYPYFLQMPENDEECFFGGYMKLRRTDTTALDWINKDHSCNQGIWIDIFPLDVVPESEEIREKKEKRVKECQRLLMKQTYPSHRLFQDISEYEEFEIAVEARNLTRKELCERLHEAFLIGDEKPSEKSRIYARNSFDKVCNEYPTQWFEYIIPAKYEDQVVFIPKEYEKYLTLEYEPWYYMYPPEEYRKPHHVAEFSATVSYVDYLSNKL